MALANSPAELPTFTCGGASLSHSNRNQYLGSWLFAPLPGVAPSDPPGLKSQQRITGRIPAVHERAPHFRALHLEKAVHLAKRCGQFFFTIDKTTRRVPISAAVAKYKLQVHPHLTYSMSVFIASSQVDRDLLARPELLMMRKALGLSNGSTLACPFERPSLHSLETELASCVCAFYCTSSISHTLSETLRLAALWAITLPFSVSTDGVDCLVSLKA